MSESTLKRLLVVDDNEAKRYSLLRTLRKAGYSVTEADCGAEALRLAQEQPDLILLDVHLPDINGFEVCRRLKSDSHTEDIPIIHISATSVAASAKVQGLECGADAYLVEPIEAPELLATVHAVLRMVHRARSTAPEPEPAPDVLLVDDDPENLQTLEEILADLDINLVRAASGADALRHLLHHDFAVVLLDTEMPEMNGFETAQAIRARKHTRETPLIFLAPDGLDAARLARGYRLGAVDFLGQPLDRDSLRAKVEALAAVARSAARTRRQLHERYAGVLQVSLDAIVLVDHTGRILEWNPTAETTFGYSRSEVLGRDLLPLILPPDSRRASPAPWERPVPVLVNAAEREELHAVRRSGERFAAELSTARVPGDPPLFAVYVRDITERKEAEARLREQADALAQAARSRDLFIAMLAHELRNPLGAVSNAAYLLQQADLPATAQRLHELIARQAGHLGRMVNDLLDVSRFDRGVARLNLQPALLNTIVRNALDTVSPFLQSRDHLIELRLPEEPVPVVADADRLEQVFINLLHNAAKFTPSPGQIRIALTREGGSAVVRVKDTGQGISPDLLPRIWDVFTQADRSIDRAEGGLGLGLALVRELVAQHGGSVSAYSAGLGFGSEFTVTLPLTATEAEDAAGGGDSLHADAARARRVLLVEDNQDAAETLGDILELWGHEVRIALNGPQGLVEARAFKPDVVLLDIGLPGMNGYEVSRILREDPEVGTLLIVALTGYGQESDQEKAREAGFHHHLTKPVNPEELRLLLAGTQTR